MATESSREPHKALQKLMELQWQRDVIVRWLGSSPALQNRQQLNEMLDRVDIELEAFESNLRHYDDA
jgi:hypothetical protein